jgi:hypothetical protein
MRGVAAGLLLFVASWSRAFAKIKFCNDFKHALTHCRRLRAMAGFLKAGPA